MRKPKPNCLGRGLCCLEFHAPSLPLAPCIHAILTALGIPGAVKVVLRRMATAASVIRVLRLRDLRLGPMMVLERAIRVSARDRRWEPVSTFHGLTPISWMRRTASPRVFGASLSLGGDGGPGARRNDGSGPDGRDRPVAGKAVATLVGADHRHRRLYHCQQVGYLCQQVGQRGAVTRCCLMRIGMGSGSSAVCRGAASMTVRLGRHGSEARPNAHCCCARGARQGTAG